MKLKHLDLFSGIGGFSLGLERTGGFETVAFCEIDSFCQKVLKKHWPDVPIHNDVRNLEYDGSVDIITGGYPCQPFSSAGKRKGKEDDRHLWPAMFGLIKKHRPSWIIGENVAGHISMGLDDVLADLESEDYECRVFVIPACAVGAPHRRDRVWIVAWDTKSARKTKKQRICEGKNSDAIGIYKDVADSESKGGGGLSSGEEEEYTQPRITSKDVTNSTSERLQVGGRSGREEVKKKKRTRMESRLERCSKGIGGVWSVEPDVGRVANGIPARVDRLKSLGNAVVPQILEIIGYAILEAENGNLSED